jgi:serine/threonine protein kinase
MLTPDTVLQSRYKIIRQLGQGGMGAVYEAIDERLDTVVALKETLFTDERLRKQFEREARLLARLHHPALPRVSDHFSEGEGQFLVMQFIPGDDLSEMMTRKRGPFPADQVLTWADQLLDALDYLHTQEPQIVHRDIKPQNLKLTARGQIILLDFGLAKGQAGDVSRITTGASIFGYTPNYAPLEQIQGLGTDSRSDLYSLGATLYHLMTGVKPPDALTRAAALVNGQPDPLVTASQANSAVGSELDEVLGRALAQNRDQRFATANDMRKALQGTAQVSTVLNRGEADTVLFPPAAAAGAVPTQQIARQRTAVAGDTTVVRPAAPPNKKVLPWAVSGAALVVLAACVLTFYAYQKKKTPSANLTPQLPLPTATPTVTTPTQVVTSGTPEVSKTDRKPSVSEPTATPRKTERARNEAKSPNPPRPPDRDEIGHDEDEIEMPEAPRSATTVEGPNRPRRFPNGTKVLPGGVVIRNLPDGSQLITMPDGTRIYRRPDGKEQVFGPGQKPKRKTPTP